MDTKALIDGIIRREGGFINKAEDRGGPTKYGITQKTLTAWRKRRATADDIRGLKRAEAVEIYRQRYIVRPRFDKIKDANLQELVIDSGVNHGTRLAAKWLQRAAGVKPDGKVGPKTLRAVNRPGNADPIRKQVLAMRVRFYGRIITRDPTQAVFAYGWCSRAAEFITK